jgi:preprotein translocase subunit SecF
MTLTKSPSASSASSVSASAAEAALTAKGLDVYKYRWLFLGVSLLFLIPGLYFIGANMANPEIKAPLRLGIDFKGGTLIELGFAGKVQQSDIPQIRDEFDKKGYTGSIIQIQNASSSMSQPDGTAEKSASSTLASSPVTPPLVPATGSEETSKLPSTKQVPPDTVKTDKFVATEKTAPVPSLTENHQITSVVSIRSKQIHGQDDVVIRQALEKRYGQLTVLQKVSMGPALARELFTNGILALGLAYLLILGYLTFRFQFDFAICAMVALLHDTIFLLGMFAMFGALFNTEVDSLFVTAVLTVVGFSVHDTIVVFDRIRENVKVYYTRKTPFIKIVNVSVNQTLTRSINTSLTALLSMLALYFFGGETTRDFVLAIIIGIAAGTYSSIFNASVLLAMWRNRSANQASA